MKPKKKKRIKARLPMEAVERLRSSGGFHSSKKGDKGYDRKDMKAIKCEEY